MTNYALVFSFPYSQLLDFSQNATPQAPDQIIRQQNSEDESELESDNETTE